MNKLFAFAAILLATAISFTPSAFAAGRNETLTGSTVIENGSFTVAPTATFDVSQASNAVTPFLVSATIESADAGTAVTVIADADVPAGKKVYVTGFTAKVNGTTVWSTTATVALTDSATAPVSFFSIAVAALTSQAELRPGSGNVTSGAAYSLGTGGTEAKGLVLKGDADGAGSDLVVTVSGYIK